MEGEEILLDSVYLSPIAVFYSVRSIGDDPFSDSVWNDLGISSVALVTQSGETILMAEQVYGTAAREPKNGLPGYGYTFIQMGERPERVFDPAEIASITIFGQTFPLDGLVPVES